jgi:dienelactone hydrolase
MKTRFALLLILTTIAASLVPIHRPQASSLRSLRRSIATDPSQGASDIGQEATAREIHFYSEGVQCYGRLFTPKDFSVESKAPAVVVSPGWGQVADSVKKYAARFAARGVVALAIDFRSWGKSGGFLQTVDAVKTDDRLRFSQMTARVRIRRKRLIPEQQILDIRNALYYLQGEPGVDRSRVGVWGTDMAGGYAIDIAANDSRVKAIVAQAPIIEGKDAERKAWAPTGDMLQAAQRLARTGPDSGPPAAAGRLSEAETRLALAQYHPFWYLEWIPQSTAVLFVIAEKDAKVNNDNVAAASKLLKGPAAIVTVPGASHAQIGQGSAFETAADAAADWFLKHL